MAACAKHFPGLGKAVLDPHLELPVVSSSKEEMTTADFIPFRNSGWSNDYRQNRFCFRAFKIGEKNAQKS